MIGYKLVRKRKDGTLGPLFINRKQVLKHGQWLTAEDHPTKGFAHRPGWHVLAKKEAPHLKKEGRVWVQVRIKDWEQFKRPKSQGGMWYLAEQMMIVGIYG